MEEYKAVQADMQHKKKRSGLIASLIIVIILAIAAVGGTWYYMNNRAKNDKKIQEEQIQNLQKQIEELKKQKESEANKTTSYTTKYELLKFAYANGWTIADTSLGKNDNPLITPGRDVVKLTSPNGFVILLDAGLYGIGGDCQTCSVLYSEPITVLGKQYFLNFIQNTQNGQGVSSVILGQKADDTFGVINAKNIKATNGDPSYIMINAKYPKGNGVSVQDLNTIKADPNIAAFKAFLQSLNY